jgi:serine/threonine-protein kinase
MSLSPTILVGTLLDRRYRLDRLVGEGASAWVFAAQDTRLERGVAIKLLKPCVGDAPSEQKQFVEEGRTLAKLVHPHVVLVHDAAETEDGLCYLVMELSSGGTLEGELAKRGKLPIDEALVLLVPLLGALACAHDRGIIHRDIKPPNIALQREPQLRAKLLDFGIAQRRDRVAESQLAVGTPSHMAPEQARGDTLTPAVDVWAMGVVFFRCLSGRLPFESSSSTGILSKLVGGRAPRFATICDQLGPHIATALDRALEPQLHRRYPDMRSFACALAAACEQDRISVPLRPEPIGLPDFELWRASADVERTNPIRGVRQNRLGSKLRLGRGTGFRSRALAGAVMFGSLLITLGVTRDVQGAGRQQHGRVDSALAPTDTTPIVLDSSVRPTPSTGLQPPSASPHLAPTATTREAPVVAPPRAVIRQRVRRAAEPVRERPLQLEDRPGIVTDWDWE